MKAINAKARASQNAFLAGNYTASTALWGETETVLSQVTGGVNLYNIQVQLTLAPLCASVTSFQKWGAAGLDSTLRFKPISKQETPQGYLLTLLS